MKTILKYLMMLKVLKNGLFLSLLNCMFWSPCIAVAIKNLYMALICKYSHYPVVIKNQNPKYASNVKNEVLIEVVNAYFSRRACRSSLQTWLEMF